MEGVDLHDGHCNNVLPSIHSKKWTWVVFTGLIQAFIVNALVIYNAARDGKKSEQKNLQYLLGESIRWLRETGNTQNISSKWTQNLCNFEDRI